MCAGEVQPEVALLPNLQQYIPTLINTYVERKEKGKRKERNGRTELCAATIT